MLVEAVELNRHSELPLHKLRQKGGLKEMGELLRSLLQKRENSKARSLLTPLPARHFYTGSLNEIWPVGNDSKS